MNDESRVRPESSDSSDAIALVKRLREIDSGPSDELWNAVDYTKRAAVLVMLFTDDRNELRCILTLRSLKLRTFPGQIAFPGGRCDTPKETSWDTALRESFEEIGFPTEELQYDRITTMPCYLSRNMLAVQPCVIYIKNISSLNDVVERENISAHEVECVFSVPLRGISASDFYTEKIIFANTPYFYYEYPIDTNDWIFQTQSEIVHDDLKDICVAGLTAHIMLDVSRIVYKTNPKVQTLSKVGHESAVRRQYMESTGAC